MQQEWIYGFGHFLLDVENRVLVKGHEPIHVPAKSLDVLIRLVRAKGRVITKGELMDKVWCYSEVEESNIYQSIYRLRCILRENAHDPIDRYIVNVSGTGYRFAMAVMQVKRSRTDTAAALAVSLSGLVQHPKPSAVAAENIGLEVEAGEAGSRLVVPNVSRYLAISSRQLRVRPTFEENAGVPDPDWAFVVRRLTATELKVLLMIAESRTSRDIALELSSSVRTVENHRASIRAKLGLSGSNALVWFAVEHRREIQRQCKEC